MDNNLLNSYKISINAYPLTLTTIRHLAENKETQKCSEYTHCAQVLYCTPFWLQNSALTGFTNKWHALFASIHVGASFINRIGAEASSSTFHSNK